MIGLCDFILSSYQKNRCRYNATETICVVKKENGDKDSFRKEHWKKYLDKKYNSKQEFPVQGRLAFNTTGKKVSPELNLLYTFYNFLPKVRSVFDLTQRRHLLLWKIYLVEWMHMIPNVDLTYYMEAKNIAWKITDTKWDFLRLIIKHAQNIYFALMTGFEFAITPYEFFLCTEH